MFDEKVKCYNNTEDGVRAFVHDHTPYRSWELLLVSPAPNCVGVWFVRFKNGNVMIVSLAGYSTPDEPPRNSNTFEFIDMFHVNVINKS
jgi:hypothetical protein